MNYNQYRLWQMSNGGQPQTGQPMTHTEASAQREKWAAIGGAAFDAGAEMASKMPQTYHAADGVRPGYEPEYTQMRNILNGTE